MARRGRLRMALRRVRISLPVKRAWLLMGGLGGLIAIVALGAELLSLQQGRAERESQDNAEATTIAIMDAQLAVQREIATFQASDVSTGPTATAMAMRILQLMITRESLESERLSAVATLSSIEREGLGSTDATPAPIRVISQVPDVAAELVEFSRFENTITAKVRFINTGEEDRAIWPTSGSYVLDESAAQKLSAYDQSNSGTVTVPAGDSFSVWAKYALPEGESPKYLTLVLPNGVLFEHLEVH
jgi:hypothetical protein